MSEKEPHEPIITDIAIIGGGIAGSSAAVMLGRQGYNVTLIDPHEQFPDDFRCEKFDANQIETITRMGLAKDVLSYCTPIEDVWICRFGFLANKMSYPHYGFTYKTVIDAMRAKLSSGAQFIHGKVKSVKNGKSSQTLKLSDGMIIKSRLVIAANGLNPCLRKQFGIEQEMLSKNHCMAIGFDVQPIHENSFKFGSLTYWPENTSKKMAYFTAFKSGENYRANLFGYWDKDDDFLSLLKQSREKALNGLMPKLGKVIDNYAIDGRIHIRPIDLVQNHTQNTDGVVFVGDAFSTSCPGAGTGAGKALIDVERLCRHHIPAWLKGRDYSAETLSSFYNDPVKVECDKDNFDSAWFLRSISMEKGLTWDAHRWGRFLYHLGKGKLEAMQFKKAA